MTDFDLKGFTPYLLNMASEASSLAFQPNYKDTYGMLRNEWRVLFHLGRYGEMTATEICTRARLHKTKVSRAVAALQAKRLLSRDTMKHDRRHTRLSLTDQGIRCYEALTKAARDFDDALMAEFTPQEQQTLRKCLEKIAGL